MSEAVDRPGWPPRGLDERWRSLEALRDEAVAIVAAGGLHPSEAEDDVHEAMARLVQRSDLDLEPRSLRALLVRVARGIAIDGWRRRRVHERAVAQLAISAQPAAARVDDILVARSRVAAVAEALPALAALERAAVYHTVSGHGPAEAAALLGVGYKSVENALGRARRKLREKAMGLAGLASSTAQRLRDLLEPGASAAIASALAILALATGGGHRPAAAATAPAQRSTAPVASTRDAAAQPGQTLIARASRPVPQSGGGTRLTARAETPPPSGSRSSSSLLPSGYVNTPVASTQPSQTGQGGKVIVTLPVTVGPTTWEVIDTVSCLDGYKTPYDQKVGC